MSAGATPRVDWQPQQPLQFSRNRLARYYAEIVPVVLELRQQGLPLREIAIELDSGGIGTRFHSEVQGWSATKVKRLLDR